MVFQCINIRKVPWEVLKTVAFDPGFQHFPQDLAIVNAWKTMGEPYITCIFFKASTGAFHFPTLLAVLYLFKKLERPVHSLTFTTLGVNSADDKLMIVFLIFLENTIWNFMKETMCMTCQILFSR